VREPEVVAADDQQLGIRGVPEALGERDHGTLSVVPVRAAAVPDAARPVADGDV
jgi:hypothetical protein